MSIGIVWFRQDLRLKDNPALAAACKECDSILCIFIDDPADQTVSQLGSASRVWLHHSLQALDASLQKKDGALHCFQGASSCGAQEIDEAIRGESDLLEQVL